MYNEVEKSFLRFKVTKGNSLILNPIHANEFLDECEKLGYIILGIDSFFVSNKVTRPSLENSLDFTNYKFATKDEMYAFARKFVEQRKNLNLRFEIICTPDMTNMVNER
ncbi:MAG TPA: hypothetical protein VLL52_20595 [Anaerolineae bacterium]|nr:hypothetical protein [Anaerolineae bacterium]